jgi:hypothetical protein
MSPLTRAFTSNSPALSLHLTTLIIASLTIIYAISLFSPTGRSLLLSTVTGGPWHIFAVWQAGFTARWGGGGKPRAGSAEHSSPVPMVPVEKDSIGRCEPIRMMGRALAV